VPAPVAGFRFAALEAGIKKRGGLDLGLLLADAPVTAAAVLTRNRVRAAPVQLTAERIRAGRARAVLVNAGCANAATGRPGLAAARATTAALARVLGAPEEQVLPASTGVIGALLPAEKILPRVAELVAAARPEGLDAFSRAILTTDRGPKLAEAVARVGARTARVVGVAKGAGMIHPDMATTLAFVVTDAAIAAAPLRSALRAATDATFNALTVDGDTSTNDTLVCMASGRAGNAAIRGPGPAYRAFVAALTAVLEALGKQIVADGEGAEHLVTVEVVGARSAAEARAAARAVATSNLVKTALFGKDPNWGRILGAAGRSGARFDPERVALRIGGVPIVRRGVGLGPDAEARAHEVMRRPEYEITLDLGAGRAAARYLTCDLGHGYVSCNADYRS
jgi:glutamate N-acetyltransferase/amino-acid N-acetyltransferase